MPPIFDDADLAEMRRVNRLLARLPRFRADTAARAAAMQAVTRLHGAFASAAALRRGGVRVETRRVPVPGGTVPVRVIRPRGDAPLAGVQIGFHGGAWCVGGARMDDPLNAALAAECGVAVLSVDYPLAPATPFPAVIAACTAAAAWLLDRAPDEYGTARVVLSGESAGAHLAALAALALRDRGRNLARLRGVVLHYGCYDLTGTPGIHAAGPGTLILHGPSLEALVHRVTGGMDEAARREARVSPLRADLSGLPPALLTCGTQDPLLDDSRLLAARWPGAALVEVPEAPHAFNRLPLRAAAKVNAAVRAWVARRLG